MSIRMKDILHKPTPLPCIHSLTLRCLWSWRSLELEFLLIALQKCVLHSDVHAHCLGWGPPSARILKNKYCFVEMLDGLAKPQHMVGNLIYPEWDPQSSQVKLCWFGGLLKHFSYFVNPYLYLHEFDVYGEVWKLDKRLWYGTTFTPLSFHVLIFRGKPVIFRYVTQRFCALICFVMWLHDWDDSSSRKSELWEATLANHNHTSYNTDGVRPCYLSTYCISPVSLYSIHGCLYTAGPTPCMQYMYSPTLSPYFSLPPCMWCEAYACITPGQHHQTCSFLCRFARIPNIDNLGKLVYQFLSATTLWHRCLNGHATTVALNVC